MNVSDQGRVVDTHILVGEVFQVPESPPEDPVSSQNVAVRPMMEADGYLDETLAEEPLVFTSHSPHVFPALVGFIVKTIVKKIYSGSEQIVHRSGLPKEPVRRVSAMNYLRS